MTQQIDHEHLGSAGVGGTERRPQKSLTSLLAGVATVAAVLALVPLWLGDSRFLMGLAIDGLLFACYAIGFNLIFGSTGQLFLAVGALAGIGGYTAAILADRLAFPVAVCIVVGGLFAAINGGVLSWIAVRRSLGAIFTGIVTLAFSLSFENLVLGLRDLTGGETGIVIDAGSDSFLREVVPAYYLFLALVVAYLIAHGMMKRSHIGWAFRALRDDEVAAELAGVNVARYRIYAGFIGSAMLGTAGSLNAFTEGRISPSTFGFGEVDVVVLVMLAFGGIGVLYAPVLGSAAITVLDELLVEFGQLKLVAYGVLLLALFIGLRRGIIPTVGSWLSKSRARRSAAAQTEQA